MFQLAYLNKWAEEGQRWRQQLCSLCLRLAGHTYHLLTNPHALEFHEDAVFVCFVQCRIPALRAAWHIVGAHNDLLSKHGKSDGKCFEGQDQF